MKTRKTTYFALFFLLSFLVSSGISIYQLNSFSPLKTSVKHTHGSEITPLSGCEDTSCNNLIFEKNEQEESGLEIQAVIVPFLFSWFHTEILKPVYASAQPVAEKLANPIYIGVCNFRI